MNIKAENVSLQFGNHYALENVNFELSDNKIFGLLGRNGAGKTSLLSIMASFREPTNGRLTINGEVPFENAEIMRQVAFLYDQDYESENNNVIEYLKGIAPYRPNFSMEYAEYLIDLFKLDREKQIKKYSKGMKSAVNVIIGLASRAPITLLDEIYLGMDAHLRDIFYKELLEEQERHPRMFILSTHLVSEMDYLFDEVVILDQGSILVHEPYDTFIAQGVTITGDKETVDQFVATKKQLNTQQLGNTKAVMVYGELSEREEQEAIELGLELTPASLHELFVHLTKEED
mgnify:FL=1